jgi:very-short-patch-repair endonuclease
VRAAGHARAQHGIVTAEQLSACGLRSEAITMRLRKGLLQRVHRGVYAVGCGPLTLEARFLAAVLACGQDAFLSHFSAAALERLMTWEQRHVEVTVVGWSTARRPGLRVHRARALDPRDVDRRHGIPVTTPARTLLDLAGVLPAHVLRRVVRQALGDRRVTEAQLVDVLTRANGHRGAKVLADLVASGPAPTRSALEDALLDLVRGAGLPEPQVNAELVLDGRRVVPDLRWPQQRLVVEADGAAWHDNRVARVADAERQALLEAHGERVLRVTWQQTTRQPQQTLARIRVALAEGAARAEAAQLAGGTPRSDAARLAEGAAPGEAAQLAGGTPRSDAARLAEGAARATTPRAPTTR